GTNRKAPGHDGRAARSTLHLDVEVEQPRALSRELVDAGRWRAAEYTAPVRAHFAVTEIVHQDEDDVGLLLRWAIFLRLLLTKGRRGVDTTGRRQPAEQSASREQGRGGGQNRSRSHGVVLRKGERPGRGPLPGPRNDRPPSLQLDHHLVDCARERERQLVSEVHRGADVLADVHA